MDRSDKNKFSWSKRLLGIQYAIEGLKEFFRKEHNAWIHLAATIAVLILSVIVKISATESIFLIIVIGSVWTAELINTAIEKAMDLISMEKRIGIKWVKDLSAAAVLISSIAALLTGCIIFIPKIV